MGWIEGIFVLIAVISIIASVAKKLGESKPQDGGSSRPSGQASLDELAARRRQQLQELARRRQAQLGQQQQPPPPRGAQARPDNLTMSEQMDRQRAQEAYEERARQLRAQAEAARQQRDQEQALQRQHAEAERQQRQRELAMQRQQQAARTQARVTPPPPPGQRPATSRQTPQRVPLGGPSRLGRLQSGLATRHRPAEGDIADGITEIREISSYADQRDDETAQRRVSDVTEHRKTKRPSLVPKLNASTLRQAFVMKEVIDPPLALRKMAQTTPHA